jgi:hypothetical protein
MKISVGLLGIRSATSSKERERIRVDARLVKPEETSKKMKFGGLFHSAKLRMKM